MPGTGVIFTISAGLSKGRTASVFAALGCTAGIVPHLVASLFGLAAILHASAMAFQLFKILGVLYLMYLAWSMWKESGAIELEQHPGQERYGKMVLRAFLINILNPKLSIFFLAFLPQFVPTDAESPVVSMFAMSSVFMLMTLIVFIGYGLLANQIRNYVIHSPRLIQRVQKAFAGVFFAFGVKLATLDR
jgi:threonine/homoserine/homoserine lactone efflux protein